jgi:diguanylate cyclase (GGDEF)-like protein
VQDANKEQVLIRGLLTKGIDLPRRLTIATATVAASALFIVDIALGSDAHALLGTFVIVVAMTWAGRTSEASTTAVVLLATWALLDLFDEAGASVPLVALSVVSGGVLVGIGILLTQALRGFVLAMEEATRRDSLTGLLNTRALQEVAERERVRARDTGRPISIAFLDLDGFKQINDSHGHVVGDDVLRTFGEAISTSVRTTDVVGRVGGDEFTLILPDTNPFEAAAILRRIRHRVAARTDIPLVTATAGYVTFTSPPESVEEMIHMADNLMYKGKRRGRTGALIGRVVDADGRMLKVPPTIDITDAALRIPAGHSHATVAAGNGNR